MISQLIQGISYGSIENFTNNEPDSIKSQIVFLGLAVFTSGLSALSTSLVWLEVAMKAKKFTRASPETVIPRTHRFVQCYEIFIITGIIATLVSFSSIVGFMFIFPAAFIACVVYIFGFLQLLHELNRINGKSYNVIREITITAFATLLSFAGMTSCVMFFILHKNNWRNEATPNHIPGVIIASQLVITFLIIFNYIVLVYYSRMVSIQRNKVQASEEKSLKQRKQDSAEISVRSPTVSDFSSSKKNKLDTLARRRRKLNKKAKPLDIMTRITEYPSKEDISRSLYS